jgi:hypothetical protein
MLDNNPRIITLDNNPKEIFQDNKISVTCVHSLASSLLSEVFSTPKISIKILFQT